MRTDYEPPSRRVSRESLGDWALKDAIAHRALQVGITEAELIHALLQDRERLMKQLQESLSCTPPRPIVVAQPEPASLKRQALSALSRADKDALTNPLTGEVVALRTILSKEQSDVIRRALDFIPDDPR
jgi:hypothetical protein